MERDRIGILAALDDARTQWYHYTTVVIAGMGFFSDAYDLFCISTVTRLLGRLYYYDPSTRKPGLLPAPAYWAVISIALVGTFAGQLLFGFLGDKLGRKKAYGITLMIMIISSLGSGLSLGTTAKSVMATLCVFRFWLGVGVGGDYPLSATIMAEYANRQTRGAFMAAVFATQALGFLAGGVVALCLSSAFNARYPRPTFAEDQIGSTAPQADFVWRIILMFGSVPAALTYYWRMKLPETARYTALVAGNANLATQDAATVLRRKLLEAEQGKVDAIVRAERYGLFSREFVRRHGLHLLGAAATWFFLDVVFYYQTMYVKDIFADVGLLKQREKMNALEEVQSIAIAYLYAMLAMLPGFCLTVALVDKLGRIKIQLQGFFFMTVFILVLGIPYDRWRGGRCPNTDTGFCSGLPKGFAVIYAFTFLFANFGANSTTFILSAELFPTRLRSTCYGIAAAAGKAGAMVGVIGFLYASQGDKNHPYDVRQGYDPGIGPGTALIVLAICPVLGFVFTFLLPETKARSLEDITGENSDLIPPTTQLVTPQSRLLQNSE